MLRRIFGVQNTREKELGEDLNSWVKVQIMGFCHETNLFYIFLIKRRKSVKRACRKYQIDWPRNKKKWKKWKDGLFSLSMGLYIKKEKR